jgi:hypothetical protein
MQMVTSSAKILYKGYKASHEAPIKILNTHLDSTIKPVSMKKTNHLLVLLIASISLTAQTPKTQKHQYYQLAVSNSHSAKPFASFLSLFYEDFHPGIDFGYGFVLKSGDKYQWVLEGRLGYMYHRWVQHNIGLYAVTGYRYLISPSWSAEIKLGGGYQHSIPNSKVFTITESEGIKKKKNVGRSQGIVNLGFGVSKNLSPPFGIRVFMEYKQQIQTPFIKEYVPILPYNSIVIGVAIPRKHPKVKSKK